MTRLHQTARPGYAEMADALPNQLCVLDEVGRVRFVNAAWDRFASANGYCGAPFPGSDYLSICGATEGAEADDARNVADGLRAVLDGRSTLFEHVYPCHAPDKERWFCLQATPFEDGALVVHVPAADPGAAGQTLVDVLSHVAHELRTPLTSISGYSDLLEVTAERTSADQKRAFTRAIRESSLYLSGVIDDMMDLARSRQSSEILRLNEAHTDLEIVASDALAMVEGMAAGRQVSLELETDQPDGRSSWSAIVDKRRLTQVLVNLLTNSVKFSPKGSRVICRLSELAGGGRRLAVIDHGAGMAPEDIPIALKPYGRTASARKSNTPGLGLGLPLSKALVEMHGGRLSVNSRPGHGTTVSVDLPGWRCAGQTTAANAVSTTPGAMTSPPRRDN